MKLENKYGMEKQDHAKNQRNKGIAGRITYTRFLGANILSAEPSSYLHQQKIRRAGEQLSVTLHRAVTYLFIYLAGICFCNNKSNSEAII
jgi:hypothetical protein